MDHESENIFDRIKEVFGHMPENLSILEEQIDEAIQTLERIIIDVKLPTIAFDSWKYVATAMPDFEKQVSKTIVTNYQRLSHKD